jgi:ribosome-associated protein
MSDDEGAQRLSKSARKRAAHAAQELGEALVRLSDAQLEALALPPELAAAIRAARRINSRAAGARQRQYIGKLMRAVDLDPIRAALAAQSELAARESERFKRIEHWRERLIAEGEPALAELARWHPDIDWNQWAQRVSAARTERTRSGAGSAAGRELFRALRALFATMPR